MKNETHHKDGAALAAIVAAGIGCVIIGLATILAEVSTVVKESLNWWPPAGPLSGKTGIGIAAWLLSWGLLHALWHKKELPFRSLWIFAMLLILLGWIGTFPPVFESFSGH